MSAVVPSASDHLNSLSQWSQHKLSLCDADMRHRETGMVNLLITVKQNIKINIPWSLVYDLLPAKKVLYILQLI
jgi:hypothetical protein